MTSILTKTSFIICAFLFSYAIGYSQFKGGNDDGHSVGMISNANLGMNIFKGGNDDGNALSMAPNQNFGANIFKGGNDDGNALSMAPNQNFGANIFKGGNDDGNALSMASNQNFGANIFKGGNDDGNALSMSPNQNFGANIFKGGNDDGNAYVTGFNLPLAATTFISNITDFFRTRQSGNWSDVNTWESASLSDFSGVLISPSTVTPDFNSNTITIQNTHTVTATANINTDQTTINSGGSLVINPNVVLTVNNGAGTDITVSSGGNLTIKSTATGTGSIGNSAGNISGDVTVERYFSNRRAWRLLGMPFSASTQTIKSSWMEGGSISPAYGTQITTLIGDPNAANFDAVRPSSSIRTYLSNNFNSDLSHTPNTLNNITGSNAYFLFVRGDRSVDRTTAGAASSATTLRITGTIKQGSLTGTGFAGTDFSLISNPYPSAIDFDAVKSIAANAGITKLYVWDASLGGASGVGQYRTIDISGTAAPYNYVATPGGADNNWRFIESGTAFFVQGNTTANFNEATKSASVPPSSMLRTTPGTETEIVINLNTVNTDNSVSLTDGVREIFDSKYSNNVDAMDAKKISGFNVNFGIVNSDEILAIEKRSLPKQDDIIPLKLWNTTPGNYQFDVQPANLPAGLTPYLQDDYLGTKIPVEKNAQINFSINSEAASSATNRFTIIFTKPLLPVNIPSSIVVYPNPVTNGIVTIQLNNMANGLYYARLINAAGQVVITKQFNHPGGNNTQIIGINKTAGTYLLEITKPDNTKQSNKIIIN